MVCGATVTGVSIDRVRPLDLGHDAGHDLGRGCPAGRIAMPPRRATVSAIRRPETAVMLATTSGRVVPIPSVLARSTSSRELTAERPGHHEDVGVRQVVRRAAQLRKSHLLILASVVASTLRVTIHSRGPALGKPVLGGLYVRDVRELRRRRRWWSSCSPACWGLALVVPAALRPTRPFRRSAPGPAAWSPRTVCPRRRSTAWCGPRPWPATGSSRVASSPAPGLPVLLPGTEERTRWNLISYNLPDRCPEQLRPAVQRPGEGRGGLAGRQDAVRGRSFTGGGAAHPEPGRARFVSPMAS